MKKSIASRLRPLFVYMYQLFVFILVMTTFVVAFEKVHFGLGAPTRTSAITLIIFTLTYVLMGMVYGKLEVGEKKSKPLFYSMTLNLFITNMITFIALRVMTIHDRVLLIRGLWILLVVYLIQLIVVRIMVELGNTLYFLGYTPENVVIINNNSIHLDKIVKFYHKHKKQYNLVEVLNQEHIHNIDLSQVSRLVLLDLPNGNVREVIEYIYLYDVDVLSNYSFSDVFKIGGSSQVIDDVLMYTFKSKKMTVYQQTIKRGMDVMLSVIALILLSPIMLIIALAIKLEDKGPAIYSQIRMTRNETPFKIYKFRSMKLNSGDRPVIENDDRITKIGHVIRRFRVDELPQLINIFKGDMSIVGPRPESQAIMDEIVKVFPEFKYRLRVKAGLTGYAQIFGKYNTDPRSKLIFDLYYIENYSLINDFKLILQTLIVFLKKDSTEAHHVTDIKESENTSVKTL